VKQQLTRKGREMLRIWLVRRAGPFELDEFGVYNGFRKKNCF
jgi:hypothetical protein